MKNFLLFFSLTFIALSGLINSTIKKPTFVISKQQSAVNFNRSVLYLNLGLERMISSSMWITTLIESDLQHYKKKDLNSWMYLRFSRILELDPLFKEGYQYGAHYLSVVKDDLPGATDLYERGLKIYPDDFFLNYQAAIHYFNETKEPKKAIPLLERIKNHKRAPAFVGGLIETLRLETGVSVQQVIQNLIFLRDQSTDEGQKRFYEIKIERLKKEKL